MRTEPADFFTKDGATTRQPVEIYHIWQEGGAGSHWYYTSGDVAVVYGGHTYEPAPIKRDTIQFREGDEVSTLSLTASDLTGPIATYISSNPVDLYWIELRKFFRDQVTPAALVLFIGQIKSVSMNGAEASVECVGFERMFNEPIPRFRYGPQCNWTLFDGRCGLNRASYKVTGTVTIEPGSRDLVLVAAALSGHEDGYFTLGVAETATAQRLITNHDGDEATIRFAIGGLVDGASVDFYPGCDGRMETCREKFNNLIRFGGHPYVPLDNPALWY
jgi:uncharacterized phage protein (TIGR02218 family)